MHALRARYLINQSALQAAQSIQISHIEHYPVQRELAHELKGTQIVVGQNEHRDDE